MYYNEVRDMSKLIEGAKDWARRYLERYPDKCDEAIEGAKNWASGYYRAFTGKEIPDHILDEIEKQLRKEFNC